MSVGDVFKGIAKGLAAVAPGIATALGTPLAGAAITEVEKALGVSPGTMTTEQAVVAAVASATPEQMLALRQADQQFTKQLLELDASDRADARKRETALKDSTPRVLAYLIIGAFIGMAYAVLFRKTAIDSALAGTVIGYLSAKAELVASYYFGSSSGSDAKTAIIADLQKK
jgi:hypothetical protein